MVTFTDASDDAAAAVCANGAGIGGGGGWFGKAVGDDKVGDGRFAEFTVATEPTAATAGLS